MVLMVPAACFDHQLLGLLSVCGPSMDGTCVHVNVQHFVLAGYNGIPA